MPSIHIIYASVASPWCRLKLCKVWKKWSAWVSPIDGIYHTHIYWRDNIQWDLSPILKQRFSMDGSTNILNWSKSWGTARLVRLHVSSVTLAKDSKVSSGSIMIIVIHIGTYHPGSSCIIHIIHIIQIIHIQKMFMVKIMGLKHIYIYP